METEPKETFGQIVKRTAREKGFKRNRIISQARLSVPTIVKIMNDDLPAFTAMSLRRKRAWANSITRLAIVLEQNALSWLSMSGLSPENEPWVKSVVETGGDIGNKRTEECLVASRISEQTLTVEDLQFLLTIQKGLQQSLTFKLAYELIRLRIPSPAPSSTLPK